MTKCKTTPTKRKQQAPVDFLKKPHWFRPQWPLDHPYFRLLEPRRFFQYHHKSLLINLEMIYWYGERQQIFRGHPAVEVIDEWLSGMFYAAERISPKRATYWGGGEILVWNSVPTLVADISARFVIQQVEGALNDFWDRWDAIEEHKGRLEEYDPQWDPDPYRYAQFLRALRQAENVKA